jgi:hypothetical protein
LSLSLCHNGAIFMKFGRAAAMRWTLTCGIAYARRQSMVSGPRSSKY